MCAVFGCAVVFKDLKICFERFEDLRGLKDLKIAFSLSFSLIFFAHGIRGVRGEIRKHGALRVGIFRYAELHG